jgi:hypothetical protein
MPQTMPWWSCLDTFYLTLNQSMTKLYSLKKSFTSRYIWTTSRHSSLMFDQLIISVSISSQNMRWLLRRSMTEKYSSKSIDDKRLISIKSNLIYSSEYWLFDVLQLTNIETYLYSTIYEMNSFDVELDLYLSRSHVVKWISRNETLRESFSRTFVLRSLAHFVIRSLRIWAWSLNRWIRLIEDQQRLSSKLCLIWERRCDD